jgi:hypothetical protein
MCNLDEESARPKDAAKARDYMSKRGVSRPPLTCKRSPGCDIIVAAMP